MGMREILGVSSWDLVRDHLRTNYVFDDGETKRRNDAAERVEFYECRGEPFMEQMVDRLFVDAENRRLRKAALRESKFNNVVARVVHEKATVYDEPAKRTATDPRYAQFLELLDMDDVMRELNRMLVLHEDVWVQYRVRMTERRLFDENGVARRDADGVPIHELEPVVDLVPPSLFWAISSPRDPTLHVATLIDQRPRGSNAPKTDPHYRLWTDDETVLLDADLNLASHPEPWLLGRMPGFLASTRKAKQELLALSPAADLVAACKFVWFQNALLLKESKSANRQTYVSGDTTAATMGQTGDSERDAFLPEGVTVQAVDRGMDPRLYRENGDHALERAGANHGLPPSVLHHRDSSSGAEVMLRRIPLRELRKRQIPNMRKHERELAEIQAMVNKRDLPDFAFSMGGWKADFGEVQQPMTRQEELTVFKDERALGLKSTVEKEREDNPDLDSDQAAKDAIGRRVDDEVWRVQRMQKLQQMNGSASSKPGDPTPAQNGARGRAAAAGDDDAES